MESFTWWFVGKSAYHSHHPSLFPAFSVLPISATKVRIIKAPITGALCATVFLVYHAPRFVFPSPIWVVQLIIYHNMWKQRPITTSQSPWWHLQESCFARQTVQNSNICSLQWYMKNIFDTFSLFSWGISQATTNTHSLYTEPLHAGGNASKTDWDTF